ncbi:hypothetical protein BSKO_05279 [Bryopsis sp. KO-2023]|nr:hypothetical protein BSKO_05279 [Bryopsis sp. KO-2023]
MSGEAQCSGRDRRAPELPDEKVGEFMLLALGEARKALRRCEVPVGCIVVRGDEVVARGSNRSNEMRNATRHAEIEAIDDLIRRFDGRSDFSEFAAFTTCEPCIMCGGAFSVINIGRVYFGCANDRFGGCGSILAVDENGCKGSCWKGGEGGGWSYPSKGGYYADEAIELLRGFYVTGNPRAPKPAREVQEVSYRMLEEAKKDRDKEKEGEM